MLLLGISGSETDLEEAAEVVQGTLGPQEAPGQNGADLFAYSVEMSDEAVGHLRQRADVTEGTAVYPKELLSVNVKSNQSSYWT